MLVFISVAESIKLFVEHIPPVGLLVGAPVAIIILGIVATAVATLIDQQLPAARPQETGLGQEIVRR